MHLRVDTSHERVTVHVDITERTGADTLAFVALGGERCVCRLNPWHRFTSIRLNSRLIRARQYF